MATFSCKPVSLPYSAEGVFHKLSDLTNLHTLLDKVPEDRIPQDQLQLLKQIELTPDSVTIPGGPVGAMTLRMTEKNEPTMIKMEAENSPVPLTLFLRLEPTGQESCSADVEIDIQIPAMLKPMVSGPLQKMADQFGEMLKAIQFV